MVVGAMTVFEEAGNIAGAIESLFAAGVDEVVCLDGAWNNRFGGRGPLSRDGTREEAVAAGATWLEPKGPVGGDGAKRNMLLRRLPETGVRDGDHLLLLDADERAIGQLDDPPSGHGCVLLRNTRKDDLPGIRTPWLTGELGEYTPMLRWLRWTDELRCEAPGIYFEGSARIHAYLVGALSEHPVVDYDPIVGAAYRAIRDNEAAIPADQRVALAIVEGLEIDHAIEPTPARIAAKQAYYQEV